MRKIALVLWLAAGTYALVWIGSNWLYWHRNLARYTG